MKRGSLPLQKEPFRRYNKIWIISSLICTTSMITSFILAHYVINEILTFPFWLGMFGMIFSIPRSWNSKTKGNDGN